MNLANSYTRFRGSRAFLFGLIAFILTWLALHWVFGLDGDLGGINLMLSAESSVSLAFFTMMADLQAAEAARQAAAAARQDAAQRQMDDRMLHMLEALHALLQRQIEEAER